MCSYVVQPLSAKFCREKLDKVRPNLPIISNEKHEKKVVKSGSSVKLKQSKFPPNKGVTKINHVSQFLLFSTYLYKWQLS